MKTLKPINEGAKVNSLITFESKELQGIDISKAQQIKAVFDPMSESLLQFEERFNEVIEGSKGEITEELTKKARRLRIDIGKVRTSTEKIRKEQKEEYLRAGKAIDGVANILKWAVTDKENKLREIEEHFERIEIERLEKLQKEREEKLSKYVENIEEIDLSSMPEDVWNAYISIKEKEYNDRIEAEKKAEAERIENERLDRVENERKIKLLPYRQFWTCENYSLRKMSETNFETILSDMEAAKRKYDIKQEKIRQENERLKKEAEEKERKRLAEEKTRKEKEMKERIERENKERKEREAHEAALKKEREKREQIEAEERERREEAERKLAEKEAEEKSRLEEEEARIQAELKKGDTEKVSDLISDLIELKTKYTFKSKQLIKKYSEVGALLDKIINHISD